VFGQEGLGLALDGGQAEVAGRSESRVKECAGSVSIAGLGAAGEHARPVDLGAGELDRRVDAFVDCCGVREGFVGLVEAAGGREDEAEGSGDAAAAGDTAEVELVAPRGEQFGQERGGCSVFEGGGGLRARGHGGQPYDIEGEVGEFVGGKRLEDDSSVVESVEFAERVDENRSIHGLPGILGHGPFEALDGLVVEASLGATNRVDLRPIEEQRVAFPGELSGQSERVTVIRSATEADVEGCVDVLRLLPDYFTPDTYSAVGAAIGRDRGWVTSDTTRIAGFMLAEARFSRAAEITYAAVVPDRRRQGLGSALLRAMLDDLAGDDIALVEVKTLDASAGYEPYVATRAFWERHGFVQIDRIDPLPGWRPGNPAAIYVRALTST
jgi:ribosomal protein S18 acetylase RimI-like enzyme